ncbi:MAG: HAMP domain-containing protein [Nitrospinae bacterium]|nr:HAMP domain-containing protein [Nitrospinota bacterium]
MKTVSIKSRLWSGLGLFIFFYFAMWALSYYTSVKISDYLDLSKMETMKQAHLLRRVFSELHQKLDGAAQTRDPDLLAEAAAKKEEFSAVLNRLQALDGSHKDEYARLAKDFGRYYPNAWQTASLIISGEEIASGRVITHAREMNAVLPQLKTGMEGIVSKSDDVFAALLDKTTRVASLLVTQNFILFVSILMIAGIVFPMIIRSIILPIEKLVHATNELAKGDLDTQAEVVRMDEIGMLAMAFNRMTRSLKEETAAREKTNEELKKSLDIRKEMQKRIVEANRDLTAANARLMEADRLKSDFLASMSHELRTPLNAIINFTDQIIEDWELLEKDKGWSEEAKGMLQRVYKSSKHLLSLINDLLDLAKIESGHMPLDLSEADIKEIAADSIASVSPLAKAKGLDLKLAMADGLPLITLDERRMLQVFINLLSNAIKFTEKGYVEVSAGKDPQFPDGVVIKVTDTGIGIPQSYLEVIFDRFRQVDGGDARKHAGTGLGLNLVKELVELHRGWVKVESVEGKGSVFIVYLPFHQPVADQNRPE